MKKTKTFRRKLLRPQLKLRPRPSLALAAIVICLGGAGVMATKLNHPISAATAPSIILCNYGTKNGVVCLNRYRGETSANAGVVGYYADFDINENFQMQQLNRMCNSGYVSSTCPFTVGTGLNNRYLNDLIVQIKDTTTGRCVGNDIFNAVYTAEEACNTVYGSGGGNGTIFVYNVAGGGGTQGYMESRYWSNHYGHPAWLCSNFYPSDPRPPWSGSDADFGGGCQWHYLNK